MGIYFDYITDLKGYIHSIDMLHLEFYLKSNFNTVLDIIHSIRDKYTELEYFENLDLKPSSKYQFYNNQVVLNGIEIRFGKYTDYDASKKLFRLLPMLKIRFNPNKYASLDWFNELYQSLMLYLASGVILKFDYAIDVPKALKEVQVFDSKKEFSYIKGSRYYGQSGKHGNLKIYDKQKELTDSGVKGAPLLTRIEHTLIAKKEPSLEKVYVLTEKDESLKLDNLSKTNRAIVEMYLELKAHGIDYRLDLEHRKYALLQPYLEGSYELLEYGNILNQLLERVEQKWLQEVPESENWVQADDEIMEMFGGT